MPHKENRHRARPRHTGSLQHHTYPVLASSPGAFGRATPVPSAAIVLSAAASFNLDPFAI